MTTMDRNIDDSMLDVCRELLKDNQDIISAYLEDYPETRVLEVPLQRVYDFKASLVRDWYDYPDMVTDHFVETLTDPDVTPDEAFPDTVDSADIPKLRSTLSDRTDARITGFDPDEVVDVGQYRPDDVAGRLVHIRGQVTKRSKRKLRDEVIAFECNRCGRIISIPQTGESMQEPHECPGCERQGPFEVNDHETVMRDFQRIRLQTLPEHAEQGDTEMIDLQVFDDMVGELKPGDRGILNARMIPRRDSHDSLERELEGRVHSIAKLSGDHSDVDVEEHEEAIEENANSDDPYTPIYESVAPFHEGDEYVKKAIAHQLFGGVEKDLNEGTWMRGNFHVLLMGDPGSGKTRILKYATKLMPRSEYVTGKASSAGLTGTAQKDEFADGGWTLQAGTLVKANGGLAAVDELDKMSQDDKPGFMEALSDQQVTITLVVSGVLPAKTSVLAAANPKYGSFDPMGDISKQLDLNEVLLSRFDLWFIMRDEPDEELDESVARTMTTTARIGQKELSNQKLTDEEQDKREAPIPPDMFKAYVVLGRQIHPVFTDDAMDRIVNEYVELRQVNADDDGPVPTTHRLVEALHRISESSARMRLDNTVTVEDVERALDIMYESLDTLGVDPDTGHLDANRFQTGKSTSQVDRIKALTAIIEGQTSDDSSAKHDDVREEALVLMSEDQFESALEKLKQRREIYEPSNKEYRIA